MQYITNEAPPAPLSLQSLLSKIQLTDSERKLIEGTTRRIADVLALGVSVTPPKGSNALDYHLHHEVDRLHALVVENPTPENVELLHLATVRERDAELTAPHINGALNISWRRLVDGLQSVALGLIDRVESLLDNESEKVRASIIQADSVFGSGGTDIEIFDARLLATRQSLALERNRICESGAALHWLCQQGFASDPFAMPSTPKPQAVEDVKLTRGRVKLPIELLAAE